MSDLGKAAARSYLMQKRAMYGVPPEVAQQAAANWAAATPGVQNRIGRSIPGYVKPAVNSPAAPAAASVLGKWGKRALIGGGVVGLGALGAAALMSPKAPQNNQGLAY